MGSPILMQNENLTKELSKSNVGRSAFNLSHSKTFPMYIGALYPCMCIPTMPTESVEINCTALLKQLSPLTVPLMADLRLNTAFFWVDYRLAWKKFERFMQGGRSGNEVYDLPKFGSSYGDGKALVGLSNDNIKKDIRTFLGITKETSYTLPEALPFFAYQMICRDFYTNVDRLLENTQQSVTYDNDYDWTYDNLFPADPDVFRLQDGVQDTVNGVQLSKIRFHEFRPDYFLSSTYAPMRGTAPTLQLSASSTQTGQLVISNPTLTQSANMSEVYVTNLKTPSALNQNTDTNNVKVGSVPTGGNNNAYISGASNLIEGAPLQVGLHSGKLGDSLSGNATLSFTQIPFSVTSAQLTWLNQLTTYKELNILCKPYFKDFLNAHFENVRIGEEQTERPVYIGGSSQRIQISEVTQVSQSTDSSPIGTVGAKAGSLDSNHIGKYFCNDYGVIIGISYILPDMIYEPAMPRWLTRDTNLDFYSPEFANLSMQAILNREFFVSNSESWNNSALGYQGAFDELRSMPNQVAGDLLNSSMSDLQHYVMLRKFSNDNKPELTHEFLSMRNNIDYSAWALGDSVAPFIGQFANYVSAIMPMPYVAVPKH